MEWFYTRVWRLKVIHTSFIVYLLDCHSVSNDINIQVFTQNLHLWIVLGSYTHWALQYLEKALAAIFEAKNMARIGPCQWNEYNWNATSIVIDGKIMKPNFAWYFTQTRVSGWSITRVSFATIPRTNYEERANDERTTWRQTWVPRESKFAVCLIHHLSVLIFARKVSFMVVHSHITVGEKKKYHYISVIQLVLI